MTGPLHYYLIALLFAEAPPRVDPETLRLRRRPSVFTDAGGPSFARALPAPGRSLRAPVPLAVVAVLSPRLPGDPVGSALVGASPQPQSGGDLRSDGRHSVVSISTSPCLQHLSHRSTKPKASSTAERRPQSVPPEPQSSAARAP